MRPIDADAALKALRKCQTYLYDARDPELKIELSSAEAAINNLPTIQPVATDTNVGDTISRQQTLDAINHICPIDTDCDGTLLDRVDVRYVLSDLPSAQPEPKWIPCEERMPEEHEWIGTKKFGTTISDEVYVTFENEKGERFCQHMKFQNGELSRYDQFHMDTWFKGSKPIAWMPLPKPFEGGIK